MSSYAVRADRFFFPAHVADGGYLMVEDGVFGAYQSAEPACEILDRAGMQIAPGYVDTHIHGFGGCDVMDGSWQGIRTIARGILANGVTSWLPTTLTAATEQLDAACRSVAERADENPGARIQGIFLEGPFFTEEHRGAQNPAYLCAPSVEKLERWQAISCGRVRKIAIAAEFPESAAFIRAARARGVIVALGHSNATLRDALLCLDAGASVFVHTYNGMSPLRHREPGMVGAALVSGRASFAELICDGHHVDPAAAAIVMRAKGHDRCVLITDCMRAGGMPEGDYTLGGLPVIVEGGTARLRDGGSLAGSILNLKDAVRNVVAWGIATPAEAVDMATRAPAEANGIGEACGSIRPGRKADFVVLEPDMTLAETYLGGESVYQR